MAMDTCRRRWSPLTCLSPATLSPSGLIVLDTADGEVETLVRTNVELRYNGCDPLTLPSSSDSRAVASRPWNPCDVKLTIYVTTHRIVFIDEFLSSQNSAASEVIGGSVPFPLLQTARPVGGPSFRSPRASYKIELTTFAWGELIIVFRGGEASSYSQSSKDRDDILNAINRAQKRKAWQDKERQAVKEASRPSRAIASRKVGVDAILTQNALRLKENANLAETAFGGTKSSTKSGGLGSSLTNSVMKKNNASSNADDIDLFLGEAAELIKVIQKYVATIERDRAATKNQGSKKSKEEVRDAVQLVGMLENMGMTSALSEKQSGSMYHKQLARQLVDFLQENDKLAKVGGMMTLTDVYCLFNRARGTNMISPEDLLKALDWMKELKLGMTKRSFPSGVLVIQDDQFDDERMANRLAELAKLSLNQSSSAVILNSGSEKIAEDTYFVGGITVMDVSRSLKISALLANEQLLSAERMGLLCRDTTIEGTRFFPNLFQTQDFSSCAAFLDR